MNENNFYNLLIGKVKKYKSKLIFQRRDVWSWKQITWQDLNEEIKNISCFLMNLGFKKGDLILFNSANTLESLIFEYASFLLGCISIPVKNDKEIIKILDNTEDDYYLLSDTKECVNFILSNDSLCRRIKKSFITTNEKIDIKEHCINYQNILKFGFLKRKKLGDKLEETFISISSESVSTIFYEFKGKSISKINKFSQEKIINLLKVTQKKLKFIAEEDQTFAYLPKRDSFSKFINLLNLQIGNRGAIASNLKDFYDDVLEIMPFIIYLSGTQLKQIIDEFKTNSLGSIKNNFGGRLKYVLTDNPPSNQVKIDLKKEGITVIELNQLTFIE